MKETFILNGRNFTNYMDAAEYCRQNGWRIVSTVTIATGIYLLTVIYN